MEFNQTTFWELLLNGMDFTHFLTYYIVSLIGVLFFFVYTVYDAIKHDAKSPDKLNWGYLLKTSALRIFLVVVALFFLITQSEAFMGEDISISLALISGIGIDGLIKSIVGVGRNIKLK